MKPFRPNFTKERYYVRSNLNLITLLGF
jgi:hypothetical protein